MYNIPDRIVTAKSLYFLNHQDILFDLNFNRTCFVPQPAHEKIGVVDSQWIIHQVIPSLGSQVSRVQLVKLLSVCKACGLATAVNVVAWI